MRILWSDSENVFVAEFSSDFPGDLDSVKTAGFRTNGPPNWLWYAPSSGVKALDYLREHKPNSGLVITEQALEKYNFLKKQFEKKRELKKIFEQGKREASKTSFEKTFIDSESGIKCLVVESKVQDFVPSFVRPKSPEDICFMCGEPVYFYEYPDICLSCKGK